MINDVALICNSQHVDNVGEWCILGETLRHHGTAIFQPLLETSWSGIVPCDSMTFITAAPDSKDSTAIYCLELFDREEVLQLSGEWTEELRYHSQAEELGRFSGKRWRLPWKWEVSSSTLFQNISNMHRTDASLTDLDTVVYIYSFTIDADYTHIYIY